MTYPPRYCFCLSGDGGKSVLLFSEHLSTLKVNIFSTNRAPGLAMVWVDGAYIFVLNGDSFIPTNISLELGRFFLILGICRFFPFSQSERE